MRNENLMIEVVANTSKVVSTLDKEIGKLPELQHAFQVVTSAVSRFSDSLETIFHNVIFNNMIKETMKEITALQRSQ